MREPTIVGALIAGARAMSDLIWVGNTLLPHGFVFLAIGLVALVSIGAFVAMTSPERLG